MTAHRPRLNSPLFWSTQVVCKHNPSIGDSDSLGEAGLGLLKVDDVPDCGKVLHEGTNY